MLINSITWNVDPVFVHLGPFTIHWYGIFWALGIWLTLFITTKIFKNEKLPDEWLDKLFMYTVIGTIIGARLGHCLFYEWQLLSEPITILGITFHYGNHYLSHPWELLYIWRGGLASHGGAIGILTAMILYNKYVSKKGLVWILDRLLIGVTLCAGSIRFGNLMNSEIYGNLTSVPWGFIFLRAGETQPMHPTQIYEMIYCIVTFGVTWWLYWKKDAYKSPGLITGTFLVLMFGSRFSLEFIKLNQEAFESGMILNMGQVLSIPFILWGVWLLIRTKNTQPIVY